MFNMNIELIIKDAQKADFNRNIARIHPKIMENLNLLPGDIIEILNDKNNKFTAVNTFQSKNEDKNIIILTKLTKKNLKANNDDRVQVKKGQTELAESVTFAEIGKTQNLKNPQNIVNLLINSPITKQSVFTFYIKGRKIDLVVEDFTPNSRIVKIHPETKIIVSLFEHEEFLERDNIYGKIRDYFHEKGKVNLNELRDFLKIDRKKYDLLIFQWAKQFGFKIEGDYLVFEEDTMKIFIETLEMKFEEWDKSEEGRAKKLD